MTDVRTLARAEEPGVSPPERARAYGEIDAFELASCPAPECDRGRKVKCTSLRSLIYYAASPSARKVRVIEHEEGVSVKLEVEGPVTHDQRPLRAIYTVRRRELLDLPERDRLVLERRLEKLFGGISTAQVSPIGRLREVLS